MLKRLILKCGLSPGDIVMLTAALRDLHKANPGQFLTDVRTTASGLWENNPYRTALCESEAEEIDCEYPLINECATLPFHCVHGFSQFLSSKLEVPIPVTAFHGDIHLSAEERLWGSQVHEWTGEDTPFWIVAAGGKHDVTIKWWSTERYQAVVDYFRGKLLFVQVGNLGHHHPKLRGTLDLRGRTSIRELVRLVHHAQGVLCPVTFLMHLAAAVPNRWPGIKPCVVVAGAREPAHWEQYPGHQFLQTVGTLECCKYTGCWRDRTTPLGDGTHRDDPSSLCLDVSNDLPKCMDLIQPDQVIAAIEGYLHRTPVLEPEQVTAARRGIRRASQNTFDEQTLTLGNARLECEKFIQSLGEQPMDCSGRGIVICAGGARFFTCAWVCIHRLRAVGCRLPIEAWHLGPEEMSPRMEELLTGLGVRCVDALQMRKTHPCRRLNGWELKAYALAYSSFREVLLLDADNVPLRDPDYLFESPEYLAHGAIFWPDYGHFRDTHKAWELLGMKQPSHPEFESGQLLVDKGRCWRPTRLALWFNEHSDFFYKLIHGDKETFHLAWRKLSQGFHLIDTPIHSLAWTMCQHDPKGDRLFQHRNTDKWSLHLTNPVVKGFVDELECRAHIHDLRSLWDGGASTLPVPRTKLRPVVPGIEFVMLSSQSRQRQREASLTEWEKSDASVRAPKIFLHGDTPAEEAEKAHLALQQFLDSSYHYLLILGDDILVAPEFQAALNTWKPLLNGQLQIGSVYHPGFSERICDVGTRTDWVNAKSVCLEMGLLVSRRVVRRVLTDWDSFEAPWPRKVSALSKVELLAVHNPSLLQIAWVDGKGMKPHEARTFGIRFINESAL